MKKRYWLIPAALLLLLYMSSSYSPLPMPKGAVVDRLVVKKSEHKLEAYSNGELLKTYTVSLGNPVGDKQP